MDIDLFLQVKILGQPMKYTIIDQ